jgi:hypothetical protein
MTRTKRRIYTSVNLSSITGLPPTVATGVVATHHTAPNSHQETFLRCNVDGQVTVDVNAPGFDIPPEFWWTQTFVFLTAFWVPSSSLTHQPTDGSNMDFLGQRVMQPRRYPLETNAGEYAIVWTCSEPLITETARKSATASTGPNVLFQVDMYDPQFVFSNGWADTSANISLRTFSLWEDP